MSTGLYWSEKSPPAFTARATGADALFAAARNFPARCFNEVRQNGVEIHLFPWGGKSLPARLKDDVE